MKLFADRKEAGEKLAQKLSEYTSADNVVVLGLPRGGVPVAYEVAKAIQSPMDIFLVRKLGVPGHEELAMGAIASGGVRVLNDSLIDQLAITDKMLASVAAQEQQELERRERVYRGDNPRVELTDKKAILVDDGIATGASMKAAIEALRAHKPEKIIVAVPVSPPDTYMEIKEQVDEFVCIDTPQPFYGVGMWYEDFSQTTDEEVKKYMNQANNLKEVE